MAFPVKGWTFLHWRILLCCRRCEETTKLCFRNMEAVNAKADWAKAHLYDAWKALAQQQKGMRRMARKIKRLQAENTKLRESNGMLVRQLTAETEGKPGG